MFLSTASFVLSVTMCLFFLVIRAIVDGSAGEKSSHILYGSFCAANVNVREWNVKPFG